MNIVQSELPMKQLYAMIESGFEEGFSSVTIGVTGNSMSPLLRHKRDTVVLEPCDKYALKRGDLPLYKRENGQFVLHRIACVEENTYTMVGDAQTELEIGLPKENVLAIVTGITRKGRFFSAQNKWYRIYVAVWLWLRPVRPVYFALGRLKRALVRRLRKLTGK